MTITSYQGLLVRGTCERLYCVCARACLLLGSSTMCGVVVGVAIGYLNFHIIIKCRRCMYSIRLLCVLH